MTSLAIQRVRRLAEALAELKVKVRAVLTAELAGAIGSAVRDVLVVALVDRLVAPPRSYSAPRQGGWRDDEPDRERWGGPRDAWNDDGGDNDYARDYTPARHDRDDRTGDESTPAVPAAAAVAVGVSVGRWWLTRKGSLAAALGVGVLAAALGLAGGPVAGALMAVLAAATDVLTAESILGRPHTA